MDILTTFKQLALSLFSRRKRWALKRVVRQAAEV